MFARFLIVCLVLSAPSLSTTAGDWPQFRGPERTGISGETGLLREWPADGPQLVWQVDETGRRVFRTSRCWRVHLPD